METVISVLITASLGTWLAYRWQQRSIKEGRYFDASKTQYELMISAGDKLATLVGTRLYASHRLCRISQSNTYYDEAVEDFRQAVLSWNREHLKNDLNIRTLFRSSSVVQFESLQNRLAALTNNISRRLETVKAGDDPEYLLIRQIENLRGDFFVFLQGMMSESNSLFRQMHFGIKVNYCDPDIELYSNVDLFKALFSGPDQQASIVRSPSDFGLPVTASNARLGVD